MLIWFYQELDKQILLVSEEEWNIIDQIIKILQKPLEVSDFLGGEKYVTSCLTSPIISQLIKDIEDIEESNNEQKISKTLF